MTLLRQLCGCNSKAVDERNDSVTETVFYTAEKNVRVSPHHLILREKEQWDFFP